MSKAVVKINNKIFKIKATYYDTLRGFPWEDDGLWRDVFQIKIINSRGISRSFRYYGSHFNYLIGKRNFSKEELLEIFKDFLYNLLICCWK